MALRFLVAKYGVAFLAVEIVEVLVQLGLPLLSTPPPAAILIIS